MSEVGAPDLVLPGEILRDSRFRALPPLALKVLLTVAAQANAGPGRTRGGELVERGDLPASWRWLSSKASWRCNNTVERPSVGRVRRAAAALRRAGLLDWSTPPRTRTGCERGVGNLFSVRLQQLQKEGDAAGAEAATVTPATRQGSPDPADSTDRQDPESRPGRARVGQSERLGPPGGEEPRPRGGEEAATGAAAEEALSRLLRARRWKGHREPLEREDGDGRATELPGSGSEPLEQRSAPPPPRRPAPGRGRASVELAEAVDLELLRARRQAGADASLRVATGARPAPGGAHGED